jgi:hypothetical protein
MRLHTLRLIFMFVFYQVIIYGQQVKMSYQAVFRDSSGELLTERLIGIKLSILNEKAELQYAERHQIKTNNLGLGTLILGDGLEKTGILESITWGKGALELKTEVDVLGGKNYGLQSMAPILSVPYAVYAGIADSLRGGRLLPKDAKRGEILFWDGQTWQKLSPGKPGEWLGVSPAGNLQWQLPAPSPGIKDMEILKDNSKNTNPKTIDTLKLGKGSPGIGLENDLKAKNSFFSINKKIKQFEADKRYQIRSYVSDGLITINKSNNTDRLEKELMANLPELTNTDNELPNFKFKPIADVKQKGALL